MAVPVTIEADRATMTMPLLEELGPMDAWVLATYSGCDIRCTY